ncbi:MAG: GNAT family N-acetyltransferase [Bryobacteraceae bacterium]|nr:GNAT family N-acetyltransferase [Bryobacteraceae bacterium]
MSGTTPDELIIRRATLEDRQAIYEIQRSAILETCRRSYPEEDVTVWAGLLSPDSYHAIHDRYFVVAERGGRILGFGRLDEQEGEVEAIYVSPAAERAGIGSAILRHLEARARECGLKELKVRSTLNAESFYARHGYQHLALIRYRLVPSLMLNCVEMRKQL